MSESPEMGPLVTTHQFLRLQTDQAHKDVEQYSPLGCIVNKTLAEPGTYTKILLDFAELLHTFEPKAESAFFQVHENWKDKRMPSSQLRQDFLLNRRQLVQDDLRVLGLSAPKARPQIAALVSLVDQFGSPGWFGAAYVLQGQSLGATLINRSLHACPIKQKLSTDAHHSPDRTDSSLATEVQPPFCFFHGHGPRTMPLWTEFLRTLEIGAPAHNSAMLAAALQGALLVFGAFLKIWQPPSHRGKHD